MVRAHNFETQTRKESGLEVIEVVDEGKSVREWWLCETLQEAQITSSAQMIKNKATDVIESKRAVSFYRDSIPAIFCSRYRHAGSARLATLEPDAACRIASRHA